MSADKKVTKQHLEEFVETAMYDYGSHVVMNRAIPDFRDGLKPVHRAILWSMYELGLHHTSPYKKAARTVGDVIGKYHPHGDAACYDAMVTIANTLPNLVDGFGNWGKYDCEAAAMRYTEARLSEFSDKYLLDPKYLAVVPYVQNFSNDAKWPLYFPAKLPVILLTGTVRAPAFGVAVGMPSFKLAGVVKAVKAVLSGEKIGPKWLAKNLEVNSKYGGRVVSTREEMAELFRTGKGNIRIAAETRYDRHKRELYIESCSPSFGSPSTIESRIVKIKEFKGVKSINDDSSRDAGSYGIRYTVTFSRGEDHMIEGLIDKINKELTGYLQFNAGYTHRKKDGSADFAECGIVDLLHRWCRFRVKLEEAVLVKLIEDQNKLLYRQELLEFAVDHLEDIFQALKSKKDPDAILIKKWKKPAEFVKEILDLQARRLAKLELSEIHARQKEIKKVIKSLKADQKAPAARVLRQMDEIDAYLKKTKDKL